MKQIFKDIIAIDGVKGILLFSTEGRLHFHELNYQFQLGHGGICDKYKIVTAWNRRKNEIKNCPGWEEENTFEAEEKGMCCNCKYLIYRPAEVVSILGSYFSSNQHSYEQAYCGLIYDVTKNNWDCEIDSINRTGCPLFEKKLVF